MKSKVLIATPVSYKTFDGIPFFTGIEWLKSLMNQRPCVPVYVLANDLEAGMLEAMQEIANKDVVIKSFNFGNDPDVRGRRKKNDKTYTRFAVVRNMVLDHVLSTDADYFVSIDSDIIVHSDCVERLVAQMQAHPGYGIIAGLVNNCRRKGCDRVYPKAVYNFGLIATKVRKRKRDKKKEPYKYVRGVKFKRGEFLDVGYTGACFIINMDMIRKHPEIRWGPRIHGEDLFLCERIREAGYGIGIDTSIVSLHMMDNHVWKGDVEAFERGEFI